MFKKSTSLALICTLLLSACNSMNPYYDASKPHHTPSGFKNKYGEELNGFGAFITWQWERLGKSIPAPTADLSSIAPNLGAIANPTSAQVTWVGHATALVQMNGFNVLTDPIFSERAAPVQFAGPKRHQAPGLSLAQLPRIHAVLISHNHYDHLDLNSVRTLASMANAPTFYVPLGIDLWFKDNVPQAKVVKADWQDVLKISKASETLSLQFLPVQHWSSRTPFDRKATLWGSWAIKSGNKSAWFSGDLGYSKDTLDIGAQYPEGFDLALIAVGAYEPRWFMKGQHINPQKPSLFIASLKRAKAWVFIGAHLRSLMNLSINQLRI